jgi:hypothetical protein
MVDRNNLAKQTMAEFETHPDPDDGRKFTELYNVDRLKRGPMLDATGVASSRAGPPTKGWPGTAPSGHGRVVAPRRRAVPHSSRTSPPWRAG